MDIPLVVPQSQNLKLLIGHTLVLQDHTYTQSKQAAHLELHINTKKRYGKAGNTLYFKT